MLRSFVLYLTFIIQRLLPALSHQDTIKIFLYQQKVLHCLYWKRHISIFLVQWFISNFIYILILNEIVGRGLWLDLEGMGRIRIPPEVLYLHSKFIKIRPGSSFPPYLANIDTPRTLSLHPKKINKYKNQMGIPSGPFYM